MRRISAWAITHPVFPLVLFAVLFAFGVVAFIRLPITLNPDISAPFVQITINAPGAAPSEIETQILRRVEASVANIGNVKHITSWATQGVAQTVVEFQIGTPIDRATNDVRDAVARVRADLPQGIEEPQVTRLDVDGGPIVYYAVSSTTMNQEQLSWFVDDTIAKRLLAQPGVARVTRSGGVDREMRVDLDPARMESYGITAGEVGQQLRDVNVDVAGGRAEIAGAEQAIRVLGGVHSALELANLRLRMPNGRTVRLGDIAHVYDGTEEIRSISRLNGQPATTFAVFKSKGASDVDTLHRIEAELAKVSKDSPGVTLKQVFTTVTFTQQSYDASIEALIEGALLAVVIVWVFLRDLRATAISALAIPLAAMPTFAFMKWFGFTLNQMTLLALSLITGVLVDDAIVEIENITRHMRMGKSAYRAAMDAADEIGLAVVACSMTIIAVFLPVSFLGGMIGQFFIQFGFTVAVAVFMSLLVARLISPLLAAYTLRPHEGLRGADGPLMAWYLRTLRWSVEHRGKTALAGIAVFAISVVGLGLIPKTFVPDADSSSSTLKVELPPGVKLSQTARVAAEAYRIIRRHPEVENVVESIGEDESGEVRSGNLYIQLVQPDRRKLSQKQWETELSKELRVIPDARLSFQSQSDGGGSDITLYAVGDDPAAVERAAHRAIDEMRSLKELRDPHIEGDFARPELIVHPRLDEAAQLGVTAADIGEVVRIATLGDLPQNEAKFSLPDRQIPIRVSLMESARSRLGIIENLPVRTSSGATVPLKAVADLSFGEGPSSIRRYDQNRRIMLSADLNGAELGTALDRIHALPVFRHPPAGVRFVEIGSAEYMQELFTSFVLAMIAGVLLVLAVLVMLFARVFQPLTILSALPLSVAGALLALLATHSAFSLATVLGILMLMGIVAKNSILLVDFAIEEMRAGKDRLTALIEAGHKRARPIVMTSVAMIAGMLPVAIGVGGSAAFQGQMAIAVIGGLVASTGLTLVMVPAVFTWIDDLERLVARRFAGRFGSRETDAVRAAEPPGGGEPPLVNPLPEGPR
ncbi:MAG: efflux RND transporter permease subunit [Gammaproteobacteria bacterium]|nr:efflux RND transporter permease subunit [Gammaproteobacteria bacterium]